MATPAAVILSVNAEVNRIIEEEVKEITQDVLAQINVHVPVKTGKLKASYNSIERINKKEYKIASDVEYAAFVDAGTKRQPNGYIDPALADLGLVRRTGRGGTPDG